MVSVRKERSSTAAATSEQLLPAERIGVYDPLTASTTLRGVPLVLEPQVVVRRFGQDYAREWARVLADNILTGCMVCGDPATHGLRESTCHKLTARDAERAKHLLCGILEVLRDG